MLTEGRVRLIAAYVAIALIKQTIPGTTSEQIKGVVENVIRQMNESGELSGAAGAGIEKIEKTDTVGLVDTYTITLTNGNTESFTVTNGKNGDPGKTPTKGTDYWTEADKATIVSDVLAALPASEEVAV